MVKRVALKGGGPGIPAVLLRKTDRFEKGEAGETRGYETPNLPGLPLLKTIRFPYQNCYGQGKTWSSPNFLWASPFPKL